MTDLLILGNGVIGISTAFELLRIQPDMRITIVGKHTRPGAASMAAGAMLACYCEAERGGLDHEPGREMFRLSREATALWPAWAARVSATGGPPVELGTGTFLLQNAAADAFDDDNFEAVVDALKEYHEPYEFVSPKQIPRYAPEPGMRALRAVYVPGEGTVIPAVLMGSMTAELERRGVTLVDAEAASLSVGADGRKTVRLDNGTTLTGGRVLIATGARSSQLINDLPELRGRVPRLFFGVGAGAILEPRDATPTSVIRTPNRGLACGVHLVPHSATHCYIGASNFISPVPEYAPRMTSLYSLIQGAMEQINTQFYKAQVHRILVGHRPTTADVLPLLGGTSIDGLFIATGTKRIGLILSPWIAREMAALIVTGTSQIPALFRPERRLIHTMTREQGIAKAVAHLRSAAYQHELRLPKAGWDDRITDMLRRGVESVYEKCGITSFGIHPEMLDMYRYGHVDPDA